MFWLGAVLIGVLSCVCRVIKCWMRLNCVGCDGLMVMARGMRSAVLCCVRESVMRVSFIICSGWVCFMFCCDGWMVGVPAFRSVHWCCIVACYDVVSCVVSESILVEVVVY